MNKGKVLEEDSPSSFHHNAAMSDRRGATKSKIRGEPGCRDMRLVYGGELMVVVVGQEAGGVSEAAGSCRGAAAAATHVPRQLPLRHRGDPPQAAWLA